MAIFEVVDAGGEGGGVSGDGEAGRLIGDDPGGGADGDDLGLGIVLEHQDGGGVELGHLLGGAVGQDDVLILCLLWMGAVIEGDFEDCACDVGWWVHAHDGVPGADALLDADLAGVGTLDDVTDLAGVEA